MAELDLDAIKAPPATDELLQQFVGIIESVESHPHPAPGQGEDFYCTNLRCYMGERMAFVLARFRDSEAEVKRLRTVEQQVLALGEQAQANREAWMEQQALERSVDPDEVLESIRQRQTTKAEVMVTPVIAAHVLFHFREGGYSAGGFTTLLIELIARADPQRRALLGLGFPGYVAAVGLADRTVDGIKVLQKIAAGEQTPAPTSGADLILDHITQCTDVKSLVVAQSGSLDAEIAEMVAAGWTLDDRVDYVAGKRIRYMRPPPAATADQAEKGCSCTPDPDSGDLYDDDGGRCSHDG